MGSSENLVFDQSAKQPGVPKENQLLPGGSEGIPGVLRHCMVGHTCPLLTWHLWGRMGAAGYKQFWGTLSALVGWARWR